MCGGLYAPGPGPGRRRLERCSTCHRDSDAFPHVRVVCRVMARRLLHRASARRLAVNAAGRLRLVTDGALHRMCRVCHRRRRRRRRGRGAKAVRSARRLRAWVRLARAGQGRRIGGADGRRIGTWGYGCASSSDRRPSLFRRRLGGSGRPMRPKQMEEAGGGDDQTVCRRRIEDAHRGVGVAAGDPEIGERARVHPVQGVPFRGVHSVGVESVLVPVDPIHAKLHRPPVLDEQRLSPRPEALSIGFELGVQVDWLRGVALWVEGGRAVESEDMIIQELGFIFIFFDVPVLSKEMPKPLPHELILLVTGGDSLFRFVGVPFIRLPSRNQDLRHEALCILSPQSMDCFRIQRLLNYWDLSNLPVLNQKVATSPTPFKRPRRTAFSLEFGIKPDRAQASC